MSVSWSGWAWRVLLLCVSVCVCVRAPPSYYTDYVCSCLNAVAEGFVNLFNVMRTFAFLVPMLFAKEGRGSMRHARNAQQCLGGPQWRFSFPCFLIILYVPIISTTHNEVSTSPSLRSQTKSVSKCVRARARGVVV